MMSTDLGAREMTNVNMQSARIALKKAMVLIFLDLLQFLAESITEQTLLQCCYQ